MENVPQHLQTPQRALATLRILWGAMVTGVVIFAVVVAVICNKRGPQNAQSAQNLAPLFTAIAFGMLVVMTPLGYFIRNQIYKRHWEENAITPAGYYTGNLLLLAMCEGVAFASFVFTIVVGSLGLVTVPGLIALAVMVVNFPTGRPMESTSNPYEAPPPR